MTVFHARIAQFVLASLLGTSTLAARAAEVSLARLDCGNEPAPVSVASFSDTFEHGGLKLPLTYSCYLVRDGDRYLLWDTGNALNGEANAPKQSLVAQLSRLGLTPDKVQFVGISHYHFDHTGQLPAFAKSTLLVGRGDWDMLNAKVPPAGMDAQDFAARRAPFAAWTDGLSRVVPMAGDRHDVFGDGRVLILSLPGHTPGHQGLLVKLETMGNVLLTGDVTHFRENYATDGVPTWNSNRADSLASLDRFRKIADSLHATVIIQHDPRDIDKLPAFPQFAK